MSKTVVVALVILLALCVTQAYADRLILTPTGSVLGQGEIRGEAAIKADSDDPIAVDDRVYWLNLGLGQIELQATRFEGDGFKTDVFGAQAAVLPETLLTPAVGIGVLDIGDEAGAGRGYYLAVSKTVPLTDKIPVFLRDIKVHAGYGTDGINGLFGGAQLGIPMGLTLAAEYDGDDFNAALGWSPIPKVNVKLYSLHDEIYYGANIRLGF